MDSNLSLAYILIAGGFLLMVAELFIPSGGILSILSATGILVGLAMTFSFSTTVGLWTLLGVGLALPVALSLAFHYWPKTPMGKRMFLQAPDEDSTMAALPENVELEQLRGQIGTALSALRPAGVVDFNGRRVDCMAEGNMITQGQTVRCVEVRSGRVLVRTVEKPTLGTLENADFS
jgi:membrane-bound ClpP family serine protease